MRKFKQVDTTNARGGGALRRAKLIGIGVSLLLGLSLILCAAYGVKSFFEKYRLQSPVVFRPMVVKRDIKKFIPPKPHQPRSKPSQTKKGIVPQVEASEPQIESFPKYLTDQGSLNREKVLVLLNERYSETDVTAMDNIFKKESGYRADALNEIGAGGVCQAYPASKMPCQLTTDDLMCQVEWCLQYVENRYGSPEEAWNFHIINNWF